MSANKAAFPGCTCPCCACPCPYATLLALIDQIHKWGVHADLAASLAVRFVLAQQECPCPPTPTDLKINVEQPPATSPPTPP